MERVALVAPGAALARAAAPALCAALRLVPNCAAAAAAAALPPSSAGHLDLPVAPGSTAASLAATAASSTSNSATQHAAAAQTAASSNPAAASRPALQAAGAAGGGRQGHGQRQHGGWWSAWGAWGRGSGASAHSARSGGSGAAAAAAGAAAALLYGVAAAGVVLAEGNAEQAAALAAAKQVLSQAWSEVEEELQRRNAKLPARAPPLQGTPPSASQVHGAVEVVVPIRDGADPDAVLKAMRESFKGTTSMRSESGWGTSRHVLMEVRSDPTRPDSAVRLQLFVPPAGGSEQAQVTMSKLGGFSAAELAGLDRLVRAANLSYSPDRPARGEAARRHGLHGGADADADALNRHLEGVFAEMLHGPLRQLMEELNRGMPHRQPRMGAEDDDDDEEGDGMGGMYGFFPPFPGMPLPGPHAGPHGARPGVPHSKGGAGASEAQGHDWGSPQARKAVEQLLAMGAQVFPPGGKDKMDWGVLAGYEEQKRTIEDCLLLPLLRPDVYSRLARATRKTFANNRPRAVLFEGPPGTGKTTSARVISNQAAVPLIYLPLEAVLSKWYGQSEQQLGSVFKAAEALGGAIIFLDELDALGGNRESGDLHEASRRLLSVLLREMEGFDAETKRTVVIGATNRKTDLDPALLSRFDLVVTFGMPDAACRKLILAQYAQQLSDRELRELAERTGTMSGRDLRDVCEHTERRWASRIIRGEVQEDALPPLSEYIASAHERTVAVKQVQEQSSAQSAVNRLLGAAAAGGGFPWSR